MTELIVVNAKVTTLDRELPEARAVGSKQKARAAAAADAQIVDAGGHRVVPGLIDSHLHLIRGGLTYNMELRWDGVASLGAVVPARDIQGFWGSFGCACWAIDRQPEGRHHVYRASIFRTPSGCALPTPTPRDLGGAPALLRFAGRSPG